MEPLAVILLVSIGPVVVAISTVFIARRAVRARTSAAQDVVPDGAAH